MNNKNPRVIIGVNTRAFVSVLCAFAILMMPFAQMAAATHASSVGTIGRSNNRTARAHRGSNLAPTVGLPNISATLTDNRPSVDPAIASPGDTLNYKVVISNTGSAAATGVQFNQDVDSNTTVVGGSVKMSPVAINDTYNTPANTQLVVPAPGVLTNDKGIPAPTAQTIASGPTTQGGTVTLNADGSFTYNPPNNFAGGDDTFTYTISNGQAPNDTATVTITVPCATINVTNPGTTNGTVDAAFSQTFTQSGAVGTATFTTASTLPAGISLSSAGLLSGTPTQPGTFPIVVTVTDSTGCTGTGATYNLSINCQTISVTNPGVNTGTVDTPFSQTFSQTGAHGSATFTTASTLPAGVSLSSAGVLSGTPTQSGAFPIVVTVTDSNGCTGTGATYNLTINCQTITVTNPGVNTGTVDTPFSQTFSQTGAHGSATFTTASTLPAGVSLSAAGVLSGTPTQTGTFPIVVTVTDSNGCTGSGATYNLTINCQTINVTNPGVTTGTVDAAFSQTFTQTGAHGSATFTTASTLPAGISLSTAGVLSGTPTQSGSFPIVVTVTDGNGCTGTGSTYTLSIGCQTITVTNPGVNTGTISSAFSQTFSQTGAHGTATFTTASTLPTGLSLSTGGVLSGTPTQPGTFPIAVTVTDSNGCSGTGPTYTLTINCQTITVTNPANSSGTVSSPFSEQFSQSNGTGTVTFTTASTLPSGLSLSTSGLLSGTPTQSGTFPIVVTVTDPNGCTGSGPTYNLTINCQTITVNNPATNTGAAGVPFNQTFTQSNAVGAATFTTASTLPNGITLAANGVLSGTTTQLGTFPIVVTVTDSNGCTGTGATYSLTIGCPTITVTNPANTGGTVNSTFSEQFTQTGGIGTGSFTTASTLPTGLGLSTAGLLSGTPTQSGTFNIVVTFTDDNGCTGTGPTYQLVIACQTITVTNPTTNTGSEGASFSQVFTQNGGVGTITWSESGALPSGLTFNTGTGELSGTPDAGTAQTYPIVVTATDQNGCQGTGATYNLIITGPEQTNAVLALADQHQQSLAAHTISGMIGERSPNRKSDHARKLNPQNHNSTAANAVLPPSCSTTGTHVCVDVGTLPAGKSVTITFSVTINTPYSGGANVSTQGTVSGSNFSNVLTDDPDTGTASDPTLTPVCSSSITVANLNDSGAGSLRQAIFDLCPAGGTISFDPSLTASAPVTITLTSGELLIDKNITINGATNHGITISGNNASRVFNVQSGKSLTLSTLTIANGLASQGGGIQNAGTLIVSNSTISGNHTTDGANSSGPGVNGGSSGGGSGIYNANSGTLKLFNSTISGNQPGKGGDASGTDTAGNGGNGGGIFNSGGSVTTVNTTITNNKTGPNGDNTTTEPAGPFGTPGVGGGIYTSGGTVILRNTIVAGNFSVFQQLGPPRTFANTDDDINGTVNSSSANNLVGVDTGMTGITNNNQGNKIGTAATPLSALLNALTDNGGPTFTHEPQSDSPAVDAGNNTLAKDQNNNALTTDQRGASFDRIINSTVDIGSFETNPNQGSGSTVDFGVTKFADADQTAAGTNVTYTITVMSSGPDVANATLTDTLPVGIQSNSVAVSMQFVSLSAPPGWACPTKPAVGSGGTIMCTRNLPATAGEVFTLVGKIPAGTLPGTSFNNTAKISTTAFDPNDENNTSTASTTVTPPFADLSLTKTGPSQVHSNSNVTYTITVTNPSSNAATTVHFGDTLPSSVPGGVAMTFVSFLQTSGPSWNCPSPAATTNCSIATLPANSTSVFSFVGHVPNGLSDGVQYTNETKVVSDVDPNSESDTGSVVTTISSCFSGPIVTNNADSGPGSLRQAIIDACPNSTITFDMTQVVSPITLSTGELIINKNLTITGPGANLLTIDANQTSRVFNIGSAGTANISGLTLANGKVINSAPGGGIIIAAGGTLTLTDSTLSGNSSSGPGTSSGGGINNQGNLTIINSTLSGNSVSGGAFGNGGGGIANTGTLTITNSTLSGNFASSSGGTSFGGAITSGGGSGATLTITNSTISGNSVSGGSDQGGGILCSGIVKIRNTIIAGNSVGIDQDGSSSSGPDVSGALTSMGHNIIGDTSGATVTATTGDKFDAAASPVNLGPLQNNGGPTQTMALLAGSTALDAGDNCVTDVAHCGDANIPQLTTDQRGAGFSRSVDGPDANTTATVDIGAFEAQVSVEDITEKATDEDTQLQFTFNVGGSISSVTATSSNTTLVPNNAANIALSGSGSTRTLTINPAANEFGSSTITVTVSGGSESMTDTFLLTVNSVNDAPSFIKGPNQTTNEDAASQAVPNWATNMSPGPANESEQQLTFMITGNTNPSLFSLAPAIASNGTLTYTPATDANGSATITVVVQDDGGTANGGQDTSAPQTFTITVNPVNDAPSFTKGPDQTVALNGGPQTVANWATNISAGPSDESAQTLTFQVTNNSNSALFSAGPAINANGTLTYTPATNVSGFAAITVNVKDNGGTTNGGVDTSASQTFTITVNCGPTVVTNTNDSGTGSLRDIILHACANSTITFDPAAFSVAGGPYTITLTSGELLIDKNLNINGPGVSTLAISGNNASRVFNVSAGTVSISDLTIAKGRVNNAGGGGLVNFGNLTLACNFSGNNALGASATGGAIFNRGPLTIINSTISGNSALAGGAIENSVTSTPFAVSIINSTISNNVAQTTGGGIDASAGAAAFSLTITGSTFSGNSAGGTGGAIGLFNGSSTLAISNSTISGNSGQAGGGVGIASGFTATFTNVTVAGNRSSITNPNTGSGGGLSVSSGGNAILRNTLIAGNFKNASPSTTPDDIAGTVDSSSSFNLIGTGGAGGLTNGVNNNQVNVGNALLAALGNYGGRTQTHALLPGSSAINAGSNTLATNAGLTTDQRGPAFSRIVGGTVDIGAFESRGFTINAAGGTPQNATILSAFGSPLLASIDGVGGDPVNGGIITFTAPASSASAVLNGSGAIANVPIAAGQASTSATANGIAGSYNVTATLTGGNTVSFALTNNKAATTTAVTSSVNPSDLNQNVTFTATVSSVTIPAGTVQFKDNGSNLGSAVTLNASGVAQLTTSALTAGNHAITADYSGSANFLASTGTLSGGQVVLFRPLIKFSQPTYSVNENGNFITITVVRSGDTSLPVTVDYTTPDDSAAMTFVPCSTANGVASPRCDFTTAMGTLRFAAGETSKTFNVLISQDAWVEGNETAPLTLSNLTGGAAFQQPSDANATLTIVDDDLSQSSTNPIDTTDVFVRMQYHDFLNREADPQGLAFWKDNIDKCNDPTRRPPNQTVAQCLEIQRINTSAAFFLSIEFQNTGYFVERMYKSGFGDIAPPTVPVPIRFTNFMRDTQEIGRNVVVGQGNWQAQLDANKKAFALAFVQRPEFMNRYPAITSATAFVDSLNANAGMVLSDSERAALIAELNPNPSDPALRADVLTKVTENAVLFQREFNRAFVLMQYFGYLRRNPDAAPESTLNFAGYNFWLGKLNQANGDYIGAEMIKGFLNSSEYRSRFGQ